MIKLNNNDIIVLKRLYNTYNVLHKDISIINIKNHDNKHIRNKLMLLCLNDYKNKGLNYDNR